MVDLVTKANGRWLLPHLLVCLLSWNSVVADDERSAAELLPSSIVLYADVPQPAVVLEALLEHPLQARLTALTAYQHAVSTGDLVNAKAILSLFEAGMGMRLPKVVAAVAEGGIHVAIDAETEGLVALVKSRDPAALERFRDTLMGAVQASPNAKVQQGEYRGVQALSLGANLRMALLEQWLVITNKGDLGKAVIDLYLDGSQTSLAHQASFRHALATRSDTSCGWGFAHIAALRTAGVAPELYSGRTDNPLAEVLVGGILGNLQSADFATANLIMQPNRIELSLQTPFRFDALQESRQYYFGSDGQARAPALLDVPNRLFALSAVRDLSEMWLRSDDLLTDKASEGIAQADSQLTTFFAGRDFGEEILGAFENEIQLVVCRQDFADILPRPAIRLPAFALQLRMKDPTETQVELRRVFQSLIGFLNVMGAMNGQPQFDLGMENLDDAQIVTATYVPERDERQATDAAINFNFSPSLAFSHERLILASTTAMAKSLLAMDQVATSLPANTTAQLDASQVKAILSDNRAQLIAQNMLEKGHSQIAAEAEIDLLLSLLDFVQSARVDLNAEQEQLQLTLAIDVAE